MSEVFPKAGSSRLEWLRQRPALLRCLPPNYDLKSSTIPCNQPPLPDSSAYPTDITLLSPSNFKVVSSCHTKSSLICIITNSFPFSALLHYESFLCIRRKLFSRCLFVPPPSFFFYGFKYTGQTYGSLNNRLCGHRKEVQKVPHGR